MENPALLSGNEIIKIYGITPYDLFVNITERGLRPCSANGVSLENPLDARLEFRKCVIQRLQEHLRKRHLIDRRMGERELKGKISSLRKEISGIERSANDKDWKWDWESIRWETFSTDNIHELLGYFFIKKDVAELLGPFSEFDKTEAQNREALDKEESQMKLENDKGLRSITFNTNITGHQIHTTNEQYAEKMTPKEVRAHGVKADAEKQAADQIPAAIYAVEYCLDTEEGTQRTREDFFTSVFKEFPMLPQDYVERIWGAIKDSQFGIYLKGPGHPKGKKNRPK